MANAFLFAALAAYTFGRPRIFIALLIIGLTCGLIRRNKLNKDDKKLIEVNSLVQISLHNDAAVVGSFLVVEAVETWGVKGWRHSSARLIGSNADAEIEIVNDNLPWSHIEPTGGKAVFDRNGKRIVEVAVAKHHP